MRKGLIGKLGAIVISLALVFTMMVPATAYGATSTRPKAPKITSCIALDNTITVKWSKVKGADFYKIYRKRPRPPETGSGRRNPRRSC